MEIKRCEHIKTDGTQCGSPALRARRFCYFHNICVPHRLFVNSARGATTGAINLPVLEDAESIQVALMQVLQLIITGHLDNKTAGLLLYGLQTASANIRRTSFEPLDAERVVIDVTRVPDTPLNADQWSEDDEEENEEAEAEEAEAEEAEEDEQQATEGQAAEHDKAACGEDDDSTQDINAVAEEEKEEKASRPRAPRPARKRPTVSNAQFFRGLSRLAEYMESGRRTSG